MPVSRRRAGHTQAGRGDAWRPIRLRVGADGRRLGALDGRPEPHVACREAGGSVCWRPVTSCRVDEGHAEAETRVRESFGRQPFMQTLGATLDEVGQGRTTIRLPSRQPLAQQHGYLHGGALISVLDSACGYAALSVVAAPGTEVLTAELKVNLLGPVAGAAVIAHGRVVRAGRTLSVCQGDAYDADDPSKHLATMLATMVVVSAT